MAAPEHKCEWKDPADCPVCNPDNVEKEPGTNWEYVTPREAESWDKQEAVQQQGEAGREEFRVHQCVFDSKSLLCMTCGRHSDDALRERERLRAGLAGAVTPIHIRSVAEVREIAMQHAVDINHGTGNDEDWVLRAAKEFETYLSGPAEQPTRMEVKREGVVDGLLRPGEKPFSPAFDAWNEDTEFKPTEHDKS